MAICAQSDYPSLPYQLSKIGYRPATLWNRILLPATLFSAKMGNNMRSEVIRKLVGVQSNSWGPMDPWTLESTR